MRWVTRSIAGLLLLALVAWLAWSGPALWQIRQVAPPLPTDAELRAVAMADDGPIRVRYLNTSSQDVPAGTLGHTVMLLEWADGRAFMIDSGMDQTTAMEFSELVRSMWGGGTARFHGSARDQLADYLPRIAGVGFTHLHIDHVQGVTLVCPALPATARLFQVQSQYRLQNRNTEEGAAILKTHCPPPTLLDGGKLEPVPGFPGLGMYTLGGHTPGSTLFVAGVNGTIFLFSGDITNSRDDLIADRGKGFLYSYVLVPENTDRTGALRHWLKTLDDAEDVTVVVSHDVESVRRILEPVRS